MSLRLSRKVICANAMLKNWSRQLKVRTLKSPRYLATKRRNVCHGANSITWANTSLPAYIQISRENPGSLRFLASVVQVVNTWKSYETPENTGF